MVSPFNSESQSGEEYREMLDFFFEANENNDADNKKAVLLDGVGPTTYSLLQSLLSLETQKDKTYEDQCYRLISAQKQARLSKDLSLTHECRRKVKLCLNMWLN